jgi:preprotein translocase subunit SecE
MSKKVADFAREVRQEGRKVTWPSRKETVTTTIVVFIMVTILAFVLLAADGVISFVVKNILAIGD